MFDWQKLYPTISAAEIDLRFEYRGDGWYPQKEDTLFVKCQETGVLVQISKGRDPRDLLRQWINLPEFK